jgi:hypothetical protein
VSYWTGLRWVLVWACGLAPVFGQENQSEIIQKLILRVAALEREVATLQGVATPAAASAPVASEAVVETPPNESRFTFHGYADVGFLRNDNNNSAKRFELGEVDLFATARISPKLSVLMETAIDTDNQLLVGSVPINVERLLLQYRHNDYFNLDIGSYRTAIGYYSTAYLRGSWFQTAISRPRLFTFEDDGGFLPLHNVGVSANGRVPSGALGLHYVVETGTSRNYAQPGSTGLNFQQNGAFNGALFARPNGIPGLDVGFSYYHDRFVPQQGFLLTRSVWTAHAVYQARRFEFLNEALLTRFQHPTQGYATVPGFYSQLAYRVGANWSPYFRFDYANVYGKGLVGSSAPQYIPWRTVNSGGIRYDLTEAVALKFELGRERDRFQPAWIRAAVQVAFTF